MAEVGKNEKITRTRRPGQQPSYGTDRPVDADVTPPKGLPWTTTAPPACPKH